MNVSQCSEGEETSFPSPIRRKLVKATFPSAKEAALSLTMCFAACGTAEKVTQQSSGLCVALLSQSFTCAPIHLTLVSIATNVLHRDMDRGLLYSSDLLQCKRQILIIQMYDHVLII